MPVNVPALALAVTVQDPLPGRLLSKTLPVLTLHVGCVIVPIPGADGEAFIETA